MGRTLRLSFSWKIIGAISVLTLVLFSLVAYAHYRALVASFEFERSNQHQQRADRRALVEDEIVGRIQSLTQGYLRALVTEDWLEQRQQLDGSMSQFWSDMQSNLDVRVDYIAMFDSDQRLINAWGYYQDHKEAWQGLVLQQHRASSQLSCSNFCEMMVSIPYRYNSGLGVVKQLYFLVGVNLTSMAPLYKNALDGDIFFVQSAQGQYLLKSALPEIRGTVNVLLEQYPPSAAQPVYRFKLQDKMHELRYQPFQGQALNTAHTIYVGYLANIDNTSQLLNAAIRNNLIYIVASIALIQVLLFGLIRRPLARMRQVIELLPLLAKSRYQEVRRVLDALPRNPFYQDETDQLAKVTRRLSGQLQSMEQQLTSRAQELEWLACHDPLTRLHTRYHFEKQVAEQLQQISRGCLFFVDLDNFKYINDYSGHSVGDRMLEAVAQQLLRVLSDKVLVARFGGDEFAFFIPGVIPELAEVIALRVLKSIQSLQIGSSKGLHSSSASIGMAAFPQCGSTVEMLLAKADLAMYAAKQKGKNTLCMYHDDKSAQGEDRGYWLSQASRAINEQRLALVYQPIRSCEDDSTSHYEALLRFRDDSGELRSPFPLILAAEESGHICDIDYWVIKQAILKLAALQAADQRVSLSVNLSARSFSDERQIRKIETLLRTSAVDTAQLIIEITETTALNNLTQARQMIDRLRELGCRIALDDFGVGFSSFHSLKSLPVDFIKIDGSFIRELMHKPDDRIFVKALVEIAEHFGYQTVAEFVENRALYKLLKELGVDYCQGYHVGRPGPLLHQVDAGEAKIPV